MDPFIHAEEATSDLGHQAIVDDDLNEEEQTHFGTKLLKFNARIFSEAAHESCSYVLVFDFSELPGLQFIVEGVIVFDVQRHRKL